MNEGGCNIGFFIHPWYKTYLVVSNAKDVRVRQREKKREPTRKCVTCMHRTQGFTTCDCHVVFVLEQNERCYSGHTSSVIVYIMEGLYLITYSAGFLHKHQMFTMLLWSSTGEFICHLFNIFLGQNLVCWLSDRVIFTYPWFSILRG